MSREAPDRFPDRFVFQPREKEPGQDPERQRSSKEPVTLESGQKIIDQTQQAGPRRADAGLDPGLRAGVKQAVYAPFTLAGQSPSRKGLEAAARRAVYEPGKSVATAAQQEAVRASNQAKGAEKEQDQGFVPSVDRYPDRFAFQPGKEPRKKEASKQSGQEDQQGARDSRYPEVSPFGGSVTAAQGARGAHRGADEGRWNLGAGADMLWEGVKHLPSIVRGSLASLRQGKDVPAPGQTHEDMPEEYPDFRMPIPEGHIHHGGAGQAVIEEKRQEGRDFHERWQAAQTSRAIEKAKKSTRQLIQMAEQKRRDSGTEDPVEVVPGITVKDLADFPENASFTIVSGLAGLGAGLPASAGGPLAGFGAGMTASGTAAYRMDVNRFLRDTVREPLNEYARREYGRDMTEEEWQQIRQKFDSVATEHGFWEAIPEAVGQAATLGLWKMPVSAFFKTPAVKNRMAKTLSKAGLAYILDLGQEATMETVTERGQSGLEARIGARDEQLEWGEAFRETFPHVFLLQSLVGPVAGGAHVAARKGLEGMGKLSGAADKETEHPMTGRGDEAPVESFAEAAKKEAEEQRAGFAEFQRRQRESGPMDTPQDQGGMQRGGVDPQELLRGQIEAAEQQIDREVDSAVPADQQTVERQAEQEAAELVYEQPRKRVFSDLQAEKGAYVSDKRISLLPADETGQAHQVAVTHPNGETELISEPAPLSDARARAMMEAEEILSSRLQMPLAKPPGPPAQEAPALPDQGRKAARMPEISPDELWQTTPEGLADTWNAGLAHVGEIESQNQDLVKQLDRQLEDMRGKKGRGFNRARKQIRQARDRLLSEPRDLHQHYSQRFYDMVMGPVVQRAAADGVPQNMLDEFAQTFSQSAMPQAGFSGQNLDQVYSQVVEGFLTAAQQQQEATDAQGLRGDERQVLPGEEAAVAQAPRQEEYPAQDLKGVEEEGQVQGRPDLQQPEPGRPGAPEQEGLTPEAGEEGFVFQSEDQEGAAKPAPAGQQQAEPLRGSNLDDLKGRGGVARPRQGAERPAIDPESTPIEDISLSDTAYMDLSGLRKLGKRLRVSGHGKKDIGWTELMRRVNKKLGEKKGQAVVDSIESKGVAARKFEPGDRVAYTDAATNDRAEGVVTRNDGADGLVVGESRDADTGRIIDPRAAVKLQPAEEAAGTPDGEAETGGDVSVFPDPEKTVRADTEARQRGEVLSMEQAEERLQGWKDYAREIGQTEDHSNEVVISLFDRTGIWSQPYADAGYTVIRYDKAHGDDIFGESPLSLIQEIEEDGLSVVGVLSAPPCTSFSSAGARWWANQHDIENPGKVEDLYGFKASKMFDVPLEAARAIGMITEVYVENLRQNRHPVKFYALENPVGRIGREAGLNDPRMTFHPRNYGDPYTKKTQLWGEFNTDLPQANVRAHEGSRVHKLRGDVPEQKAKRSETPEGFAYAFFVANNTSEKSLGDVTPAEAEGRAFEEEGIRIYPTQIRGESYWAVQLPENRGTDRVMGDELYADKDEARQAAREKARIEREKQEMAETRQREQQEEEQLRAEREDIDGFGDDMPDYQRGRVIKTLNKQISYQGRAVSRKDLVREKIAEGWRVVEDEEGRRLESPDDDVYLSEDSLTKTGLDYARYLGERADSQEAGAAPAEETAETEETPPAGGQNLVAEDGSLDTDAVSDYFAARLAERSYNNITEARKEVENAAGIKIEPDSLRAKELEEAIEVGVVKRARQIVDQGMDAQQTYDALVDLYQRQPTLGKRTSTSMAQQAYSTPAPVAYVASRLAGIDKNTVAYDPAAGNGMLLMEADPSRAIVNELNTARARNLDRLGFSPLIEDATQLDISQRPGVVIANPPFGKVKEEDGSNRVWRIGGYETTEIDHAIALKALEEMAPDGRAVLIIGGKEGDAQTRTQKYRAPAARRFWNQILTTYNVTGHYSLSGDLYKRQGAGFPIDIIVIDGYNNTGKPSKKFPGADVPPVIQSFDELRGVLDEGYAVSRQQEGVGAQGQRGAAGGVSAQKDRPAAQPGDVSGASGRPGTVDDQPGGRGRGAPRTGDDRQARPGSAGRAGVAGGWQPAGEPGDQAGAARRDDISPDTRRGAGQEDVSRGGQGQQRADTDTGGRESDRLGAARAHESVKQQGSEFQQTYTPTSGLETMGTQVPRNMADTTAQALEDLENRRGRVDQFVADELGYDVDALPNYFAAEQVDAIGLALDNIKQGFGFIIGDQTGIGKGRVNAAIIQYARKNNIMPVFVTYSPNLYADMVRDLNDIGIQGFEPLVTNAGLKGKHAIPLPDGRQVKTGTVAERLAEMGELQSKGFESGYDGVFTTYAQLQSRGTGETDRQRFFKAIAPRSLYILDESHNAGGSQNDRRIVQQDPNKMPRSVVVRDALMDSPYGAFYSSATYAKRPDVMGLYFKTDMSLAVDDVDRLSEAVERGGVPLQQAVAAMLSESGQYIRRERSFQGVTFDQQQAAVDRQHPEKASRIMQAVRRFDELKEWDVSELAESAAEAGEGFVEDGAVGTGGMESTKFTSVMHNLIDQFLLATKAESAVQRALEAYNNDEKPVIAVANTMESFLDQYARINELENGDAVSLDFSALFNRYLERSREVLVKDPAGNEERRYLRDDELSSEALDAFNQAKKVIEETDFTGLPVSPIDYMLQRLEAEGLSVGELTGRNRIIRYNADFAGGVLSARKRPNTNKLIDDFNAGKTDVLLLNSSGSTGLSIHSSENFSDRRKRRMIVAQPDKDINVFMQILGRVFRTGQVTPPAYELLHADIPAEKRPAAVLSQKMASLNANTTAGRKTDLSADTVDFFNEYGDEVVAQVMYDNREIHNKLGRPLRPAEDGEGFNTEGAVRKVTGRIPLLSLAEQERLYDQIISEYQEYVEALEKMGVSMLEAKVRDLRARTRKSIELTPAKAERQDSPFAAASRIEEASVRKLGKPYTGDEIRQRLAENLGTEATADINTLQAAGRDRAEQIQQRLREQARKWANQKLEAIEDQEKKNAFRVRADAAFSHVAQIVDNFYPGAAVELSSNETVYDGVVLNIEQKGRTESPVAASDWKMTVALNDASRQVTLSFSRIEPGRAEPGRASRVAIRRHGSGIDDVIEAFEEGRNESRETRYIVTGNILAGFSAVDNRGQIVNYTRDDGATEVGVLLPKDIKINELVQNQDIGLPTADHVLEFVGPASSEQGMAKAGDKNLRIDKVGDDQYRFQTPAAKKRGGRYFLNKKLLDIAGDEFVQTGNMMRLTVDGDTARKMIEQLMSDGIGFVADNYRPAAKEVVGLDQTGWQESEPGAQYSIREPQNVADVSDADIKAAFSRFSPDSVEKTADGEIRITKQGGELRIQKVDHIDVDQVAFEAAYGRRPEPGERAAGEFVPGRIRLVRGAADRWTLDHESFHWLRQSGFVRNGDYAALKRAAGKYAKKGRLVDVTEEDVANYVASELESRRFDRYHGRLRRALQKIADLIDSLANLAVRTSRGVIRDIESGKIAQQVTGENSAQTRAYTMAGPGARISDPTALDRAMDMQGQGASREQIWQETGWWQMVPGQWSFEIDDAQATLRPTEEWTRADKYGTWAKQGTTLKDILDHPWLYEAYPGAGDIKIGMGSHIPMGRALGSYDRGRNAILVREDVTKSILVHEVQHAIQEMEGFARGGSVQNVVIADRGAPPTAERLYNRAEELLDAAENATDEIRAIIAKEVRRLQKKADLITRGHVYKALAGEAEARLVQRRMEMTPAQKKSEPPWKTLEKMLREEKVLKKGQRPEDVLIVEHGAGATAQAAEMPQYSTGRQRAEHRRRGGRYQTYREEDGRVYKFDYETGRWVDTGYTRLATLLKDQRLDPAPQEQTVEKSLLDKIRSIDGIRSKYQRHVGDPLWRFFSQTVPEAAGRRLGLADKINRGFIFDYRKDPEFVQLREETNTKIRQARRKAAELASIINSFPRAEQIRIGQVIEGSVTVTPKRYEAALKAAEEFKRLEAELQELGILGQDNRFRQLTRRELADKWREIGEIESKIAQLEARLQPTEKVVKKRSRRVSEAISEKVSSQVVDAVQEGKDFETQMKKAVRLNEDRVREALLNRGFGEGEARQMIDRIKRSVVVPEDAKVSSATEIRETITRTIDRTVREEVVRTKTYSRSMMARARGSIIKDINKLKKQRSQILERIQTHYKMSGKQYLRLAYDTVEENRGFMRNLRRALKKNRLKRGYDIQRKDLDEKWRWEHRLSTPKLVMKGISEEAHDAELMRMFVRVANNPKWAVPADKWDSYVGTDPEVDYESFKPMPTNTDKLGPLAGMMVDPYIYDDLNQAVEQRSDVLKVYDELLSLWKTGKVVWNPAAQSRNLMSGFILANMGDLPVWRVDIYARAASELKNKGEIYNELHDRGVLGAEWAGHEISTFLDEAERLDSKAGNMYQQSVNLIKKMADVPARSYQGIEQFFKIALYMHSRERGMNAAGAAAHAEKWAFNYGKIPPVVRWAKRWYSPFITFTYKAMPRMVEVGVRKPWKLAKYWMLYKVVEEGTRLLRGESEEEVEREKKVLPEYMQKAILPGMLSHVRVPVSDQYGRSKYLDLSYIMPWGDIGEMWGQANVGVLPRAFMPSHPLFVTVAEVGFDEIMFTGEPLSREWHDRSDYMKAVGKQVWRQMMPQLAGSYSWNKLMSAALGEKDWAGRDRSMAETVFDVFFGIRLRSIDYNEQLQWRVREQQDAIRQLRRDFISDYRQIHIQRPSGDPEKQRRREERLYEKYNERAQTILDNIVEMTE